MHSSADSRSQNTGGRTDRPHPDLVTIRTLQLKPADLQNPLHHVRMKE